jgi:hypothetical protein
MKEQSVDSLHFDGRVRFHGNPGRGVLTVDNVIVNISETLTAQRAEILKLPSQEDGMRMDRVHGFRERLGIPKKEIKVLEPRDFQRAVAISGSRPRDNEGEYLYRHGVILVKRDPEMEALNGGPEYTEGVVVHEIAHSEVMPPEEYVDVTFNRRLFRTHANMDINTLRQGFVVGNSSTELTEGYPFEEGYAELIRGKYVEEELGMQYGFGGKLNPQDSEPNLLDKYTVLEVNESGNPNVTIIEGAMPAFVLELLIAKDPMLFPALRESRRSVNGLREVAHRINAIKPGLYQRMRKVDLKADDGYLRMRNIF